MKRSPVSPEIMIDEVVKSLNLLTPSEAEVQTSSLHQARGMLIKPRMTKKERDLLRAHRYTTSPVLQLSILNEAN